jgi:phosphoglycerate dehydrogenase-like enzyme
VDADGVNAGCILVRVLTSIVPDGVWALPGALVEHLRREFPRLEFVDAPRPEDRARELADAEIAFLSRLKAEEYAAARRLRWIQSPAAGVGNLLFPALRDSGVVVTNARGIHGSPIAEHVIAVTIALLRQIPLALRRQLAHQWVKDELPLSAYRSFADCSVGLVGLGAIGSAIAEKAAALGARVSAVRRQASAPHPPAVSTIYPPEGLATLLAEVDVLVLAAPLTASTAGLIGTAELRLMKPSAILVNIARGKLVRESELIEELAKGSIAGAALDVFEHEPLDPASPLWDMPNVLITPHTSGFRADYWEAAVNLFSRNLSRYLDGRPLLNVVDKNAGY